MDFFRLSLLFAAMPFGLADDSIDDISIISENTVALNSPWKIQINSIGIEPINYVKLATKSPDKILVEYCRPFPDNPQKCTSKSSDPRFVIGDFSTYNISLNIKLAKTLQKDSTNYRLNVHIGNSLKKEEKFAIYLRQAPSVIEFSSRYGNKMLEGTDLDITCRVNRGFPRGSLSLQLYNTIKKSWVEFSTAKDTIIRKEDFQPAILERRIKNEYFTREFTKLRCLVQNSVDQDENIISLTVKTKTDVLSDSGPLVVACPAPTGPLSSKAKLVCTLSKNSTWPPLHLNEDDFETKLGSYTTVLRGKKTKYFDMDTGIYSCSAVDEDSQKLCSREITGNFKNEKYAPKVKVISFVPVVSEQTFVFECFLKLPTNWKGFTLKGELKSSDWTDSNTQEFVEQQRSPIRKLFTFKPMTKCKTMIVSCKLETSKPIALKLYSKVQVQVFCDLSGTLKLAPDNFKTPINVLTKIKAFGIEDPLKELKYVWDRQRPLKEIYEDPGPDIPTEGNIMTVPLDQKYRGSPYNYRIFAYKIEGDKYYASNAVNIAFQTAMCSFKPHTDIILGIYANMNPHCSISDDRYNVEETWFELFYKPFIIDMIRSLPIGNNHTRIGILPTTDSEVRYPELKRMESLSIDISESRLGSDHLIKLFKKRIYRLNATVPHTTSARSCMTRAMEVLREMKSELRSEATRIYIFSIDLFDHHCSKKTLFKTIIRDTRDYSLNPLSKAVLKKGYKYFETLNTLKDEAFMRMHEIWMHLGSYCPIGRCYQQEIAEVIGFNKTFPLLPHSSLMYKASFDRQWFPRPEYMHDDPANLKCFIKPNMPGLKIARMNFYRHFCKATSKRMDANILELETRSGDHCVQRSIQNAICTAMLGKPVGVLSIKFKTDVSSWKSTKPTMKTEELPDLHGNILATAEVRIKIPQDATKLTVLCRVKGSESEDEKVIAYRCSKAKPADPQVKIKPPVVTESRPASVVCYTANPRFYGKLCLLRKRREDERFKEMSCRSTETSNDMSILFKIPSVKPEMDSTMYSCQVQDYIGNVTSSKNITFLVGRTKVKNMKLKYETGPRESDKTVTEKNILLGYWLTVTCAADVGLVTKMHSSLTLERYRKGFLDVKFISDEKNCEKDPKTADVQLKCDVKKVTRNEERMTIQVSIPSATSNDDKNEFKCHARNALGKISKSIVIQVLSKPNIVDFQYRKKNKTIVIFCDITCKPKPEANIKILEHSGKMMEPHNIHLTEIRAGICRIRFFFKLGDGHFLAEARCSAKADFLGKTINLKRDLTIFVKPAIFPPPVIEPSPAKKGKRFTVRCKFSKLHLRLATSILLFKRVELLTFKRNLPCVVRKPNYTEGTGLWKKREINVKKAEEEIHFELEKARVKDAGEYLCGVYFNLGEAGFTKEGTLKKVVSRPEVTSIFFMSDGKGDSQTHFKDTEVMLGCQANVGNKDDAANFKVELLGNGTRIKPTKTKVEKLPDDTHLKTLYKIEPSLLSSYHNTSFVCKANDDVGTSSRKGRRMYVKFYPINHRILPRKSKLETSDELICVAYGYPKVFFIWTWKVGDQRFSRVGSRLPAHLLPRGTVKVTCSAQNLGKDSISLKAKTVIVDDGKSYYLFAEPQTPSVGHPLFLECPFYTPEPSSMVEWYKDDGEGEVFLAEWTPSSYRLASSLERRNISMGLGQHGPRLVFTSAELGDSGSYRCRFGESSVGFLSMSSIEARSPYRICVHKPPNCEIFLNTTLPCFLESDEVTLQTHVWADQDGCQKPNKLSPHRHFVVLLQSSGSQGTMQEPTSLFSRLSRVSKEASGRMSIRMSPELNQKRLVCAIASDVDKTANEKAQITAFDSAEAQVDVCVQFSVRNITVTHLFGNETANRKARCSAWGNPRPQVTLWVSVLNFNFSESGEGQVEAQIPNITEKVDLRLICSAWNEVRGQLHHAQHAKTIRAGLSQAKHAESGKTKRTALIVFLTIGGILAITGGVFIAFWQLHRLHLARRRALHVQIEPEVQRK